jgi:hypothetical protein
MEIEAGLLLLLSICVPSLLSAILLRQVNNDGVSVAGVRWVPSPKLMGVRMQDYGFI